MFLYITVGILDQIVLSAILAWYSLFSTKSILVIHNLPVRRNLLHYPFEYIMDYFIQKYSITICVSDKSSRDMVRIRGFTPNPYVIHNGTVGSPFDKRIINNFNSDCFNVLVASRLSRNKGIIILITAIAEVIKLKPEICVNLHIFGMGDESYLIEINDKVRNLLCDHVVLHGFVKGN